MTTTRRLVRAPWVTVAATLFLHAGGTVAWAKPAPIDTGDGAATAGGPSAATSGTSVSQRPLVAAISAALAIVGTLVVAHVVGSRRRSGGLPATA